MNVYLLQLVGKWMSFSVLSVFSFLGLSTEDKTAEVLNSNTNKNIGATAEVVNYQTIKSFDASLPNNISKVSVNGINGVFYTGENGEKIVSQEVINEQIIVGSGPSGEYKGIMTGYGPDCKTCSGIGNVACKTVDKKVFNLINDGIYYEDKEHGKVRVLAAALTKFPCGTIIEIDSPKLGKIMGVVLDTGYDMRKNLEKGIDHIDLAHETEKDEKVLKTTDKSGNVGFNVQRWGW